MFDAKRKKVKKTKTFKRPKVQKQNQTEKKKSPEKIPMKNDRKTVVLKPEKAKEVKLSGTKLEIINGTRLIKRKRRLIAAGVVALLMVVFIILNLALPTGLVEAITNSYMKSTSGKLPATSFSNEIKRFDSVGNALYLLNDSYVEMYSPKGGAMQIAQHNMKNAELCASEQRTLVFDRGKRAVNIYNNKELLFAFETENDIFAADIATNGAYAVATDSVGYASQVEVYNKKYSKVYTWYSSDDLVSDVLLSNNGKQLAVSMIFAKDGVLKSKVYVLKVGSSAPSSTFEFDYPITSLEKMSGKFFVAMSNGGCSVIGWKSGTASQKQIDGNLKFYDKNYNKFAIITSPEANDQNNHLTVFNKKAEVLFEFDIYAVIKGIAISQKYVYILSENNILKYDSLGNFEISENIYNVSNIAVLNGDRLIYTRSSTISELEF